MILAIDTSTDMCSVGLYDPTAGLRAEATWLAGREHTKQLLPEVQRLLQKQGLTPSGLIGLTVAIGPGSFTGLRVGLATAKGLAFALDLPIWGVPTLDVLGYAHSAVTAAPVCAVLRAGRGRVAHATYRTVKGAWQRSGEYQNTTIEELIAQVESPTLFCGEIEPDVAAQLYGRLGSKASVMPPAASLRRAGFLAELAWQRAQQGERDDLAALQALYLQMPGSGNKAPAPAPTPEPEPEPEPAVKF